MSDSPLEELEAHEHAEHAEHAAHSGNRLVAWVSMTIAILAVLSAIVGSLETVASGKALEKERDEHLKASETAEGRHHRLTVAATLLHMGIAISTIAIIAGKRWPWLASLVLGVAGSAIAVWAYL